MVRFGCNKIVWFDAQADQVPIEISDIPLDKSSHAVNGLLVSAEKKHRQGSHLTKLYHQPSMLKQNKLSLVINLLQLAMEAMAHFVDSAFHHFPWKYPAASDPTESWMHTM